jgi:hypothetical protein
MLPDDFFLPFGGKLNKENRWVRLAQMIPWWEYEDEYGSNFKPSRKGQVALTVRIALGTLIIKNLLNLSDKETVRQISENCYIQYFLGFPQFIEGAPFAESMVTYFRKRFKGKVIDKLNEQIAMGGIQRENDKSKDKDDGDSNSGGGSGEIENKDDSGCEKSGKLILDATCTPADIQYPTDIRLLNDAREKLEEIIDTQHGPDVGWKKKARTYRQKARASYLSFTKQRKPNAKTVMKMKGKMLRYVRRDLKIIEALVQKERLTLLSKRQYRDLLVIGELYRQQTLMLQEKNYRIEDRIVSISQPHVRPIVRGKVSAPVEFGAKLSVSVVKGYIFTEKLEWDAYNEGSTLIESVERYRERFGFYPEAVLADKIYRNKENRDFCKRKGIRLSGPKLGRPSEESRKEDQRIAYKDSGERNEVESKFGIGKRKYTMDRISAKRRETSETTILLNLLVMNLQKRLSLLLRYFSIFKKILKFDTNTDRVDLNLCVL